MSFTLKEAKLWRYIKGMANASPALKAKTDDTKDRIEKIYARKEKICKFKHNAHKAIAKIGKMCIEIVQKKFFSVKVSRNWTLKNL